MSKKIDDIEIRSEAVQEILTKVPHWMIRWGNVLFLCLILLVLFISWFIKYPDVITSEAIVTTELPPQKEFAKTTGQLEVLLVEDNQLVQADQPLAVIENTADYSDVFALKSVMDTIQLTSKSFEFPIDSLPILELGDIAANYALFETNYLQYIINRSLQLFGNGTLVNKFSLVELRQRLISLKSQKELNMKELDNEISRTKEEITLLMNVIQSFIQLKKSISDWELRYVLKSEIDGTVSFSNHWTENQTINQGDLVFTIIPRENSSFVARIKSPAQNFGKIKVGQKVNIKLEIYLETEFGMLAARIDKISMLPDKDGFYLIEAVLPKSLVTTYNKELEFRQEMRGVAEIVTEDLRLIERFFHQFKSMME